MLLAAVLAAGLVAAFGLPRERLPALASPRVLVEARYPGMGAEEIRSILALPLEDALASVKGVRSIATTCRDGEATVALDFRWGDDSERAAVRTREAVDAVYPALPEGAEKPVVLASDPASAPLAVVSVAFRDGDLSSARRLAEYELRSRFRRIDGIGRVAVAGGVVPEIAVSVDLGRAAARGLTVSDLARLLSAECADVPAGTVTEGERELVVVSSARPDSEAELASLVLSGPNGPFRLSDLAAVGPRPAPRTSVFVSGGREAVALELFLRSGADPVATASAVRSEAARCAASFGSYAEIDLLSDASRPVSRSIADLAAAAAVGAVAAAAVLAFFLRDGLSSVLIALTIPFSAAASFAVLAAAGRSLNTMSLGGLALGIGIISDNAVVVLNELSGAFRSTAARPGVREVSRIASGTVTATAASTATTVVVFVPILFLPGPIGAVFSDLALSLVSAVLAGWLLALLALPALYRALWRSGGAGAPRRLETLYRRSLRAALRAPALVLAASALAAAGGTALALSRNLVFMGPGAVDEWIAEATFPAGTELGAVAREGAALSAALASVPGVARVYGRAGAEADEAERRASGSYRRERLVLRCAVADGADPAEVAAALRLALRGAAPPHLAARVFAPADAASEALGLSGSRTVAVRGADPVLARAAAGEVLGKLSSLAGGSLSSAVLVPSGGRPELRVIPDREASAVLGVSGADAAMNLRTATEGGLVARLEIAGRSVDVRVLGAPAGPTARKAVEDIPAAIGSAPLPARAVSRTVEAEGPAALARSDREDVVYVEAVPVPGRERELDRAVAAAAALPGAERADRSAFSRYGRDLALTLLLVLALLYLTMGAQFESFSAPILFMTAVPLAMAGVGPALLLSGSALDSSSVIGMVVLFGNAVNNAIILYETSRSRSDRGSPGAVAAYAGAGERVRPVLVTALTAAVALLPVALSSGGAAQRGMAAAMIGGTLASTALTLYVTPLLLARSLGRRRR
jgi:multidrug efflux pump subunit AcrB